MLGETGNIRLGLEKLPSQEKEPPPPIPISFFPHGGGSAKKQQTRQTSLKTRREKGKPTDHLGRSNLTTQQRTSSYNGDYF